MVARARQQTSPCCLGTDAGRCRRARRGRGEAGCGEGRPAAPQTAELRWLFAALLPLRRSLPLACLLPPPFLPSFLPPPSHWAAEAGKTRHRLECGAPGRRPFVINECLQDSISNDTDTNGWRRRGAARTLRTTPRNTICILKDKGRGELQRPDHS